MRTVRSNTLFPIYFLKSLCEMRGQTKPELFILPKIPWTSQLSGAKMRQNMHGIRPRDKRTERKHGANLVCVSKGDILAVPSLLLHHFSYETFVCTVPWPLCGAFLVLLLKEKKACRDPPGRSCVTAARWNEKGRTSRRELFFRGLKKEGWREGKVRLPV